MKCTIHTDFFDDTCEACKQEYLDLKGIGLNPQNSEGAEKKFKELSEERAKKLYEDLMLQYLKSGISEIDADGKAKAILRKQCAIRGITPWRWV